jgi:hypothetical protein
MSSIMDALKRIERDERSRQELPFDAPPPPGSPPRRRRGRLGGTLITVFVLGVGLGAAWFVRGRSANAPESIPEVGPENIEVAAIPQPEEPEVSPEGADAIVPPLAPPAPPSAMAPEPAAADIPAVPAPPAPQATATFAARAAAEGGRPARPDDGGAPAETEAATRERLRRELLARREAVLAKRTAAPVGSVASAPAPAPAAAARPWQRPMATAEPAAPDPGAPAARLQDGGLPPLPGPFAALPPDARAAPPPPLPGANHAAHDDAGAADAAPPAAERSAVRGAENAGAGDGAPADGAAPAVATESAPSDAAPTVEQIQRRPPRGAPRINVSFLFYSDDPGRRRVMLTINDAPELVTLYEGQTHESFEVARILPDGIHLRYQGLLYAVVPHP